MKIDDKTKSKLIVLAVFAILVLYTFAVQHSTKKETQKNNASIITETYTKAYEHGYSEGYEEGKKVIESLYTSEKPESSDEAIMASREENSQEPTTVDDTSQNTEDVVYISKSGNKYHTKDCHVLRGSGTAVSLEEALAKGKSACKICFK